MDRPSFSAKYLRDGTTALQCKETGIRYIVASVGRESGAYREGELMFTGERAACVNAVESNARWELRA